MDDYGTILGKQVYNQENEKLGIVDTLYLGSESGEPVFIAVTTGWTASNIFVPLEGAEMDDDKIIVPYTKEQVVTAPQIEQNKKISTEDEDRLYTHYGLLDDENGNKDEEYDNENQADRNTIPSDEDPNDTRTDNATVRPEEEIGVDTHNEEAGRYRLRKYIVTDTVTLTVPVEREEVRLERTPIVDENSGNAINGQGIPDEKQGATTRSEVPNDDKKVTPKETLY